MEGKAKGVFVLLSVIMVFALALAGGGFYLFQKEKERNIVLQEELDDIRSRQKMTEVKLLDSQKLITTLELKLEEARFKMESLETDLKQERSAKDEALAKIEQLRVGLEEQKNLRSELERKFNLAQKEAQSIQSQLKVLEAKRGELEEKVKDLEVQQSQVELGKIVVTPESAQTSSTALMYASPAASSAPKTKEKVVSSAKKPAGSSMEGKVLVVNKDYSFAVINLGSKDGVAVGTMFSVHHNNKYIGDVKVEKVHETMAAAGFVSDEIKNRISEGDKVVRKAK